MDVVWTDAVLSLGVGLGLAAAAGLRVFLPLLVLGIAARFGGLPLVSGFEWLASWPGLTALGAAMILEIAAYYLPWVDNLLDLAAGPLAVVAGVLATAAVSTELPPALRWSVAIIAGGGTAGAIQGLTSIARLKSLTSSGGLANPALATLELVGSLIVSILAIALPLFAIIVAVALVVMVRRAARVFRRAGVSLNS